MRSESLGTRRLAVASARPAGTPAVPRHLPVSSDPWFGGVSASLLGALLRLPLPAGSGRDGTRMSLRSEGGAARHLARRWINDLPADAAAVARGRRSGLACRGDCDGSYETNPDQLGPAGSAGRDRRGRQAL